jgi:hypothetical protein
MEKNINLVRKYFRQDMGKVWADFQCAVPLDVKQGRHLIDIAHMAADRGVSFDKTVGLKNFVCYYCVKIYRMIWEGLNGLGIWTTTC